MESRPPASIGTRSLGNEMSISVEDRALGAGKANVPLDALTSLRFFAALAVVFYHSGAGFAANSKFAPKCLENLLNNGWLGVPFFFILSGFILSYAHRDIHFDAMELKQFAVARFSRLYPVYLLTLLISAPFAAHYQFSTDWFQFVLLQTWFPGSGATDWNFVAWTLSVEAFFYLIFPTAFIFIRGLSNAKLLAGLGVTVGVLGLIWLNMTPELGDGELDLGGWRLAFPIPLLRVPEFVYGMILGVVFLRGLFTQSSWVAYAALATVVTAAAASTADASQTLALLAFGPLIISLASIGKGGFIRRILDNPVLVALGGASYTLYLLQYPLRQYVAVLLPDRLQLFGRFAFAPALICISVLVFLYYEAPMRRLLRGAFAPSRKVLAAKPGVGG
jgi:peptidoglycan/LPS O-acetylase OafA/YrhL